MARIKNYQGSYEQYSNQFQAAKNENRLHNGMRKFTRKQFEAMKAEGTTVSEMIGSQSISRSQADKAFKKFQELQKASGMQPGQYFDSNSTWEKSYWGNTGLGFSKMGYHTTLSGFMKDKHTIHFMITYEIDMGDLSREEVLDEYGYHE